MAASVLPLCLLANRFLPHHWNSQSRLFIGPKRLSGSMGSINVGGACFVVALCAPKILLYSQQADAGRRPLKGSPVGIARHG